MKAALILPLVIIWGLSLSQLARGPALRPIWDLVVYGPMDMSHGYFGVYPDCNILPDQLLDLFPAILLTYLFLGSVLWVLDSKDLLWTPSQEFPALDTKNPEEKDPPMKSADEAS